MARGQNGQAAVSLVNATQLKKRYRDNVVATAAVSIVS